VSLDVSYDRVFVGGEWRPPRSRETFPDYDPGTRELISQVARGGIDDIHDAVAAAHAALPGWRERAPGEPATILRRWAGMRIARQVRSGQVSINEFANSNIVGLPFNVAKESGFNHGGGYNAENEFTREKAVTIRLLPR
jgi:acyl-CoA reductase-like NAD-dependent aldehyde dehydrogenase